MAIKVIILGLRRSGTTIFWNTLAQDKRFLSFDEPFNPLLYILPRTEMIKNPRELVDLHAAGPEEFWERYSPIHFTEELQTGLSDRQEEWLRWIGEQSESVMMDITRCHFKLEALHKIAPDAVVVHLWRSPEANATSHLLPSASTFGSKLRKAAKKRNFWTRPDGFDNWSFERIVGRSPKGLCGQRMAEAGLDVERIYSSPAVVKLMAYWWINVRKLESDAKRLYGDRFISLDFDQYCREPFETYRPIYDSLGWEMPELDTSRVHPAKPPYEAESADWAEFRSRLGIELPSAVAR